MRNKERAVIEILTVENVPPTNIHRQIKVVYEDHSLDISTTGRAERICDANLGHANMNQKPSSGRPRTASDEVHRNLVDEMIKENRRFSQRETVNKTAVSSERVQALIADLGYRRL